jgi:uncharacterized protein (UPF0548 family)
VSGRRSAERLLHASRDAPLTYPEVGATAEPRLPSGYRHVRRQVVVGQGDEVFRATTAMMLRWGMHRRAGVDVWSTLPLAEPGVVVVLGVGVPPLRTLAPCRVVYGVDEQHRRGFAYGTLPGHPAAGEEAFVLEQQPDGEVVLRLSAFSRPATWYARLGGPVTDLAQDAITRRYVTALRREGA